jgi:hypothetical protein
MNLGIIFNNGIKMSDHRKNQLSMDMKIRTMYGGKMIGLVGITPEAKQFETTFVADKKYVKLVNNYIKVNNINMLNQKQYKEYDFRKA